MKKIAIVLIIGLIVSAFPNVMSAQETTNKIILTKTNKVEKTAIPDLHNRAWNWVNTYFNTEDLKIVNKEVDEEKIEVEVSVALKGLSDKLTFTVIIDLKENGYTYSFSDGNSVKNNEKATKFFTNLSNRIERAMITGFTPEAKAQMKKK